MLAIFAFISSAAFAQIFHGAGILKQVNGPCAGSPGKATVGDTITYRIRVVNLDEANDTLTVNSGFSVQHHQSGDVNSGPLSGFPVTLGPAAVHTFGPYTYTVQAGDENLPGGILTDDVVVNITDTRDQAGGVPQTFNQGGAGQITIIAPVIAVTKTCTLIGTPENPTVEVAGTVSNPGTVDLHNVKVTDSVAGSVTIGDLAAGASTSWGPLTYLATSNPAADTATATGYAFVDPTTQEQCFPATASADCSVNIPCNPHLIVTKQCVANPDTGNIDVSYTITNDGNETASNISVSDIVNGVSHALPPIASLPPGGSISGTDSYPAGCGPQTDVIEVTAHFGDGIICPAVDLTFDSAPQTCELVRIPNISVTKNCGPASIVLGGSYQVSGQVCNTGNTALNSVIVTDSILGVVFGPATLAAGQCVDIPAKSITPTTCGPSTDSFHATGTDACDHSVSADSNICTTQVDTHPGIEVTKVCGPASIVLGQSYQVSGSVHNSGDSVLNNVTVTDTLIPGNVFGPLTLQPGQTTPFGPFTITPQTCGPSTDKFHVAAVDACNKSVFGDSLPCTTQVGTHPTIEVTKVCGPASIVLGQSYQVSGSVHNTGDSVLNNVTVTDNLLGTVFGPATLQPGQTTPFGPFTITPQTCGPSTDKFHVTAVDACNTSASGDSLPCTTQVDTHPGIEVTKVCGPASIVLGQSYQVSGSVHNTGDSVLHNVTVTDSLIPGNVFGPVTLQPGQTTLFGPFTITPQACGPSTDKFHVTAVDACNKQVSGDSLPCTTQVGTHPRIEVAKVCGPASISLGQSYQVSGSVKNTGDSVLNNVTVTDNLLGTVFGPATLQPGQTTPFGPFTITPQTCSPSTDTFHATAVDACNTQVSGDSLPCTTKVNCPPELEVTKLVACVTETGCDVNNLSSHATGVKVGNKCPTFCYRVIIHNPSATVPLTITSVGDAFLNGTGDGSPLDFTQCVPALPANPINLPPGGTITCTISGVQHCVATENEVTVVGQSTLDSSPAGTITKKAQASVDVLEASLTCEKFVSSPDNLDSPVQPNHVTLAADGLAHAVTYSVSVANTGDVDLLVTIQDPACAAPIQITVPANSVTAVPVQLCTVNLTCETGPYINTVTVTGVPVPQPGQILCLRDSGGNPIQATSQCSATVECRQQQCVTRTQGYWFNHVIAPKGINPAGCATLTAVFNKLPGHQMNLGFTTVNLDQALGMFWTKGPSSSALCKARQKLATQLIAAISNVTLLNELRPGCVQAANDLISDAQAAAASCSVATINEFQSKLDAFNNSGDPLDFPAGLNACGVGKENKAFISAHSVPPGASCGACP